MRSSDSHQPSAPNRLADCISHSTPEEARQLHARQGAWVGFNLAFPEGRVAVVYPGSPADRGGVQMGDCVETMNGQIFSVFTREQARAVFREVPLAVTFTAAEGEHSARCVWRQRSLT